jgi:DNA-directed RNA polymerase specialized sigma24 family protein
MVFDEDLKDFLETLKKSLTKYKELKEPKQANGKTYSVEKIREIHQKAYLPWTAEDDNKLELLFCEGKKAKELAEIFGRNVGAINSRIKKLEFKDKYGE